MGSSYTRTIISLVLFAGIFFLPWWLVGIFLMIFFVKYDTPYEGLGIALIYDIFYFAQRDFLWGVPVFFVFFGLFFVFCKMLRRQLRI